VCLRYYNGPLVGHHLYHRSQVAAPLCQLSRSNNLDSEDYHLLGYDAVYSVELHPKFRRNVSPPSSGSKNSSASHRVSRWQAETCLLDGLLNYSSTLKMEAIRPSETSGATDYTASYPRR
jgi:hypothetical protein